MKLKKVTALLLATSMVLSSVSVASFADELVFEDEVVATEDNAEDEVSFDDVVFEDAAEEEADYAEDVFVDEEVVEDTAAVDEAFYTEEVVEELPVEEQADPNADIYAALAGDEEVVVEDVVDGETVTGEEDYADPVPVKATLATTDFTYKKAGEAPTFNYKGVSTSDNIKYNAGWDTVDYTPVGDTPDVPDGAVNPWDLKPGTYTVTFHASFTLADKYTVTIDSDTTSEEADDTVITVEKAELYAKINKSALPVKATLSSMYYGYDDPTAYLASLGGDITLSFYTNKAGTMIYDGPALSLDGAPVFESTYEKGDDVGTYYVSYEKGLSTDEYTIVPVTSDKAQFTVKPAEVTVTAVDPEVAYGETPPEPEYTLVDAEKEGSVIAPYSADTLTKDIDDGKVTLSVFVTTKANGGTKVTEFNPGTYYYSCELSGASKGNFKVAADPDSKYTVTGIADITFEEYKGAYDGKAHGIIVTPDPSTLPSFVTILYSEKNKKSTATKTPVERVNPGTTTVYYFVEQNGTQTDFGFKTITIEEDEEADEKAAKAVENMIDALPAAADATAETKPAADAAKEAYDALNDVQKALVPAEKVKKLDDVKAAADAAAEKEEEDKKAAKAVEEQIDALPAAAEATADTKPAADAAKAAYDALTDDQKALVPADKVQKLNDVKAAADKAAEEKEKEAEKEAELFNEEVALVKEAKSGAEGKAAAEAAKEAYENLSPEAKAKLTDDQIAAYEATQEAFRETKEFVAGSNKTATRATYRVLSNGEVTYQAPVETTDTWYVVPNQIKHNGFLYRVVKVSITAFNGCENTTKIVVGKYVQSIGKYAFKNTKAMKTLKIKTAKLTAGKVTNAFVSSGKSGGAKLTVVTPSGMASAYESLFKGEGGMNASATFAK